MCTCVACIFYTCTMSKCSAGHFSRCLTAIKQEASLPEEAQLLSENQFLLCCLPLKRTALSTASQSSLGGLHSNAHLRFMYVGCTCMHLLLLTTWLSMTFWDLDAGTCFDLVIKTSVRSDLNHAPLNLSHKFSIGLKPGLTACHPTSSTLKHFFMRLIRSYHV